MSGRVGSVLLAFFLGLGVVSAQSLEAYWRTSEVSDIGSVAAAEKVEQFIVAHQGAQGPRHLAKVFRKFHSSFLKNYEAYADFSALFTEGTYDCLTATTLLSNILGKLGYQVEVVETTYHIFIKVHTEEGMVFLETTDRLGGFMMDEESIAGRVETYRKQTPSGNAESGVNLLYRYRCSVYQTVTPADLIGLLLYNQAVKAYNRQDWMVSAQYLEKSFSQYPSARCYELAAILLRTVNEHAGIDLHVRQTCIEHLGPVIIRRSGAVASN
jgi:hypothetical protein